MSDQLISFDDQLIEIDCGEPPDSTSNRFFDNILDNADDLSSKPLDHNVSADESHNYNQKWISSLFDDVTDTSVNKDSVAISPIDDSPLVNGNDHNAIYVSPSTDLLGSWSSLDCKDKQEKTEAFSDEHLVPQWDITVDDINQYQQSGNGTTEEESSVFLHADTTVTCNGEDLLDSSPNTDSDQPLVQLEQPLVCQQESNKKDVGKSQSQSSFISEEDITKSPSSSEAEEEEVVQDGEVVYKSVDEEHVSDYRREIPKFRDDFITGDEPGDIGDRLVAFENYEQSRVTTKEEVTPGKLESPFMHGTVQTTDHVVQRDEVHFSEMDNVRKQFEEGRVEPDLSMRPQRAITPPGNQERVEYVSNEDVQRDPNIVRSADVISEQDYLPKPGLSQQMVQKLKDATNPERDYHPPRSAYIDTAPTGAVEYENEPERFEQWENKEEGGIYENEPVYNPDVVHERDQNIGAELPEVGFTQNVLQHFKTIISSKDSQQQKAARRELTPPLAGPMEYSSEPHGGIEKYEGRPEAGIFESEPLQRSDVVKEGDRVDEVLTPESGYAKNVAKLFRELSASGDTNVLKGKKEFTPPPEIQVGRGISENIPVESNAIRETDQTEEATPPRGMARNMAKHFLSMNHEFKSSAEKPKNYVIDDISHDYGGIYENEPVVNETAVHSDEPVKELLPEVGQAKSIVAQFRRMENSNPNRRLDYKEFTPPRDEPRIVEQRNEYLQSSVKTAAAQPDGVYDDFVDSGGIFENVPEQRSDVIREADTDWSEGLPTRDTTRNLVARFKNIQKSAEVEKPKPVVRKNGTPSSRFRSPQLEKCSACQKAVYLTERFEFNKSIYHKNCFKCTHCRRPLTPATYAVNEHLLYCMTHYRQLFKERGNYDEGFGRKEYKKRWQSEPNLTSSLNSDDDNSDNY